ncbi:MAG: DUF1800 domain-containing protein [Bacteroidota bacterium]
MHAITQKSSLVESLNFSLAPYTGPWTRQEAAHLLRRATFGFTRQQLDEFTAAGLEATMQQLFADQPPPAPPVHATNGDNVPAGQTWIDSPLNPADPFRSAAQRLFNLSAWLGELILEEGISLRQQLSLFWHNHFAINNGMEPRYNYQYVALFQAKPWGDFRQLVKDITIDPLMLIFLNGNQNTAEAPNENYARELLELFTIGKGPQVGPGDYTNYTEDDVIQMARVLTGWVDRGFNSTVIGEVSSTFRSQLHDSGSKQLSHRFNNVVVENADELEYANLVDIIFQQDEVARFICRKLYRWFVYYEISDFTENGVIEPMAQILIDNDYEIRPALKALLCSEHFFDVLSQGPMIKNPISFSTQFAKLFELSIPATPPRRRQQTILGLLGNAGELGMSYFTPPNVAGWKAYYQEPLYYRLWINSATLPVRQDYVERLVGDGIMIGNGGTQEPLRADLLAFVAGLNQPEDPNLLIDQLAELLFPRPIAQEQKVVLKDILIPGLPDFEWTVEYGTYAEDPTDEELAASIQTKLRRLLVAMLNMPEYQLS